MIKISDKYYIKADTNNYMLAEKIIIDDKKSKNYGKERFEILGYYASLEYLLNGFKKTELRKNVTKNDVCPYGDKYYQKVFTTIQRFIDNQ